MKVLFVLLFVITNLYAFEYVREYEGSITLFGKVGSGVLKETQKDGNYTIDFISKPTKSIETLSGYKSVEYISKGRILSNGAFRPDTFTELHIKRKETKKVVYIYHHDNKSITKKTHSEKKISKFSFVNFVTGQKKYKLKRKDSSKEIAYAADDYLTLVRNARLYKLGKIKFLGQKKTSSLKLTYAKDNLFRFETKTKDSHYSVEMQTDEYGLKSANTYKSFKFGKAYIKTIKTTVKVH